MNLQQWIINLASKLRKQFPQEDGRHAVYRIDPHYEPIDTGYEADPTADNRPEFVKADEVGWQRLGAYNDKR